jgi:hypothetical protein
MKAQAALAVIGLAGTVALASGASASPGPAAAAKRGEPRIGQMVVLDGRVADRGSVVAKRTAVAIGRRTCAVAAATPLAALLRADPHGIRFRDYGSCSRRPGDSSGLFVKAMYGRANRGLDGWVYKVGRRLATSGAADTAGPFGDGRLRDGQRVVWFYCVFEDGSCQRSLELTAKVAADGAVEAEVGAYDDTGEGGSAGGVRVVALQGSVVAGRDTTGSDGVARLSLESGTYELRAVRAARIPAFPIRVRVR